MVLSSKLFREINAGLFIEIYLELIQATIKKITKNFAGETQRSRRGFLSFFSASVRKLCASAVKKF